jgi:Ca-activated chloride channel family protein
MKLKSTPTLFVAFLGLFALLIGGRYLGAFPTIPQPTDTNTDTISWDAKQSHPYVLKGSDADVLVKFQVKGQEVRFSERAPINLVLVIDRSGSMSEAGKLEYAKEAAKRIISGLASGDRIGIVAYSTEVQLLYPIQFLKEKQSATSVVDSLYPTDSTNLSGGLSAGIDQLKSLKRDGYINRVILLSDGLANVGITDIGQLSRVASQAAENSIHITTMGLGLNYDENLMMNLAEYGAGNYYFIESPNQLTKIFEKEFGQILATVGKDSVMYLSLAPGVQLKEVYGYTYNLKDGRVQINLGDIFGGQERNILIKLAAPTDKLGKRQLVKASFEFTDITKNNEAVSMQRELAYEITEHKDKVAANENKEVTARGVSVDAAYQMYQATTYYERGDYDSALNNIKKALGRISVLNNSPQKTEATMKQEEELRKAVDMFEAAPALESDSGKGMIKDYKAKARQQQK